MDAGTRKEPLWIPQTDLVGELAVVKLIKGTAAVHLP